MAFQIDLSQAGQGLIRVADFPDLARARVRNVLREQMLVIAADVRASIQSGGGRRSLPGAPPHSQSGNLESSVRPTLPRSRLREERAYVLTEWPRGAHGHLLESGTDERIVKKTGQKVGRVLPRPFLVPAARRHAAEFIEGVEAAIAQTIAEANAR